MNTSYKENENSLVSVSLDKIDIDSIFEDDNDFGEDFDDNDFIDVDNFNDSGINVINETDLTDDQRKTIAKATDWYKNRRNIDPVFVIGGAAGTGKAIPVNTIVPTPFGNKVFGDLKVGDLLFDRKGKPTKITAIYEQGILDNYEITFEDERKAYSNNEHLWTYIDENNKFKTDSLKNIQMISIFSKVCIPINNKVEYEEKKLLIPPYVLGYFIASKKLNISDAKNKKEAKYLLKETLSLLSNVLVNDIIPNDYMYCSVEQRFQLVQGLMDAKGFFNKKTKKLSLNLDNQRIADQIRKILFSLGYTCSLSKRINGNYLLSIDITNEEKKLFFNSKKKADLIDFEGKEKVNKLLIKSIKWIGNTKMRCIDVDNDEHLFLMNDYIVTHNCLHEDSSLFYENHIGKIKDVKVNDKIYGADGKLCNVTRVFPQKEKKQCYKIVFNDDTSITCDLDQLFNYSLDNKNFITGKLDEILENHKKGKEIFFPINKLLRFKKTKLPISPTLIGFLLNYGCTNFEFFHEYFTLYLNDNLIHEKEMLSTIVDIVKENGYIVNTISTNRGVLSFTEVDTEKANIFKNAINNMQLINPDTKEKHIPFEYIYNSLSNRMLLFDSLLTTSIKQNDIVVKVSKGMEDSIRLFIETMGGLIFNKENDEKLIALSNILSDTESNYLIKKIKNITELKGKSNTICITVDNADKLYLSNDCIVVHNTSIIPHFINNIDLKSSGHALPYNAKVLKRNGFVPIVTLKVGDKICGGNGDFVTVKGIYPQGPREMYKVTFSDGVSTLCDKEHLWTVATLNEKFNTYSLSTLMNQGLIAPTGRIKYRIPLVQPVQFTKKKVPIHPYLLGALINGTFNRGDVITFRTKHKEVLPRVKELLARHNFKLSEPITNSDTGVEECYILSKSETLSNNWLNNKLHELGLRNLEPDEKFIPPVYLFGSPEQRRQLLNGLIDTMGSFCHKSDTAELKRNNKHAFTVEFISKSKQLLKDIKFLVESLGGVTDLHEVSATHKKIGEGKYVNTFEGFFRMSIKVRNFGMRVINAEFTERCNLNKVLLQRTIKSIEKTKKVVEAICIEVDEPNGLFVTNDFIVTHNTTVNSKIAYTTFTGRAAMVLQQKGVPATTIHKLIYEYKVEKDPRTQEIKKAYFIKKPSLPPTIKLIVVDEFSMVSEEIMNDLKSYNIPIIMFGDPHQLLPVGGNTNSYLNRFDAMLEQTHRQASDSPILRLATNIRNGDLSLKYGDYGELKILPKSKLNKDIMFAADQVICGTNMSRQDINNSFRRHLYRNSLLPEDGDKVICLKNNWMIKPIDDFYLVNGMIGRISYLSLDKYGKPIFDFTPNFLDRTFFKLRYEPKIFLGEKVDFKKWNKFNPINQFDYGYAITCHKAQGGEFDNVVVWEEVLSRETHANWLYSSITRAKESLIIFH